MIKKKVKNTELYEEVWKMTTKTKDLEEKNIKFFKQIAKYYDLPIFSNWLNSPQKKILNIIKIKPKSRILDVGFGTGNFLKFLYEYDKSLELYGIDISKEMLDIARKKLNRKAKLKLQPVEKLKKENYFDYVFSTEAFHHFPNQDMAIRNMHNSLKNNGKLIIIDLTFGRFFNWLFHKIEPGNSKMNMMEDFKILFKQYKFKNIKQKKLGWFFILTVGEK